MEDCTQVNTIMCELLNFLSYNRALTGERSSTKELRSLCQSVGKRVHRDSPGREINSKLNTVEA